MAGTEKTIDMIQSPLDGKLVVVSMVNGAHVCAACHEPIHVNDSREGFRPVEKRISEARVLVHAKCIGVNADERMAEPKLVMPVTTSLTSRTLDAMRAAEIAGRRAGERILRDLGRTGRRGAR